MDGWMDRKDGWDGEGFANPWSESMTSLQRYYVTGTKHEKEKINIVGKIKRMRRIPVQTEDNLNTAKNSVSLYMVANTSLERIGQRMSLSAIEWIQIPKWGQPVQHLPNPGSVVGFNGQLFSGFTSAERKFPYKTEVSHTEIQEHTATEKTLKKCKAEQSEGKVDDSV
ncbi:hypothetical protein EDB85DRAFT_1893418 [Lactarius pseudohatsudake]|nr:hypothetical protein EDB85DRAFT_1893418 [Lactarius pseudohatsudake]